MSFVVGALGGLFVFVLFVSGMYVGWAARSYFEERIEEKAEALRPAAPEIQPMTAEQIQEFKEDQEAFSTMLHYSPEQAYGITGDPLPKLTKKE